MIRSPHKKGSSVEMAPGQIHYIANRLRRYFAPASIMPPPRTPRGTTGNRNVALTANNSPNSNPTDSAVLQFKNGVAVWHYSTTFKNPPIATATAITQGLHGPQEIFVQGFGTNNSIIFKSTDTSDARTIFAHAIANPD
jgi:hypothetical protein